MSRGAMRLGAAVVVALALAVAAPAGAWGAGAPGAPPTAAAASQVTILRAGQPVGHVLLRYRGTSTIVLTAARTVVVDLPPGARPSVRTAGVPRSVDGPLAQGAPVGRALVRVGSRVVASTPLETGAAVARSTLGQRLGDFIGRPLVILALSLLAGCSLMLAYLRARAGRRGKGLQEPASGYRSAA